MRMELKCDRPRVHPARKGYLSHTQKILWAAVACLLAVSTPALAGKKKPQPPRVAMGIVVDASENPIVGAVVEMTDVQTGKKTALYTQDGGHYQFSGLQADHDYKVQASYKGVASEVRTASSFDTRNTIRLNLHIPPPKDE
jgi:Carboxypeptidase regulatory-like domain